MPIDREWIMLSRLLLNHTVGISKVNRFIKQEYKPYINCSGLLIDLPTHFGLC